MSLYCHFPWHGVEALQCINGQGSAGLAAPTSRSASFPALVFVHGVEARPRPSEANAELRDEGVEPENSRSSTSESLAQRDVSTSEARVFGPGVGPSGPLDLTSIVSDPNRSLHTSKSVGLTLYTVSAVQLNCKHRGVWCSGATIYRDLTWTQI